MSNCPQCGWTPCLPDCTYFEDDIDHEPISEDCTCDDPAKQRHLSPGGRWLCKACQQDIEPEPIGEDNRPTGDTCPHCGAPIEGTAMGGWVLYQCGRHNGDIDGEGFNACEYAASLRKERDSAREGWSDEQKHTEDAQQEAIEARKRAALMEIRAKEYYDLIQALWLRATPVTANWNA